MLKVAICDDENTIHSQFENVILQYAKSANQQISVSSFTDGKSLCASLERNEQYVSSLCILSSFSFDVFYFSTNIEIMPSNNVNCI